MLAGILTCANVFAATDPFAGTWMYNAHKSPKPTITYAIKDLGGDHYSLIGSTGSTIEIKADGVSIKTPTGATVAFRNLDDHDWEMVRDDGQKMVRTYNISSDDKTTDHDYAVPTHEYQTDQSSLKYAQAAARFVLGEEKRQRQLQKQPHHCAELTRSVHIRPKRSSSYSNRSEFSPSGRKKQLIG